MSNKKIYTVIGLMSGTSMDGLDCSLIKTDGKNYCKIINEKSYEYSLNYKVKLKKIINNLPKYRKEQIIYAKNFEEFVTKEILRIIRLFIKQGNYNEKKINLIGLSGQTIIHNPRRKLSIQLGSGEKIFQEINIPVVSNFRDKDILFGGQGAPIGCFYHKLLLKKICKNCAIINIGGVSNITLIYNKKLVGFDLGPGNAIIDDLIHFFYKKKYDKNGSYAKKGLIIDSLFEKFKKNIFFNKKFPKSLDRNHFKEIFKNLKLYKANDSIKTASLMTVYAILRSLELLNKKLELVILTGGGRKNLYIFDKLKEGLTKKSIKLKKIDTYKLNGDMIEAQMFGYLAVRSLKNLPISLPTTTGVKKPLTGGIVYK